MFSDRSVMEILVLMFIFLVAFIVGVATMVVAIIEIRDPAADTSSTVAILGNLVSGLFGVLLGLLVRKSGTVNGGK